MQALPASGSAAATDASPPPDKVEAPDQLETAQLVWTTLIALDQANRTGNYSVLRDLGGPGFRDENTPAALAEIFRKLREVKLELGRTVLLAPVYDEPPAVDDDGRLQIVGRFITRPLGIRFNLQFEQWQGRWAIDNLAVGSYQPGEGSSKDADGD